MNTLDYIIILVTFIGLIYGYIRGIIKQLSFGAGLAMGITLAMLYNSVAGEIIQSYTNLETWICIPLGFIAIVIIAILISKVLGIVLSGLLKLIHLSFIDSILGAIFSAIIAILLLVGAVNIAESIAPDNNYTGRTMQKSSLLYPYTQIFTSIILEEAENKM